MKCCCECHCGQIPPHDAMNDRLYWVEIITGPYEGTKCAAWRAMRGVMRPWVITADDPADFPFYKDSEIRIIHEIIPEE